MPLGIKTVCFLGRQFNFPVLGLYITDSHSGQRNLVCPPEEPWVLPEQLASNEEWLLFSISGRSLNTSVPQFSHL